jgi:hypothetical protein
VQLGTGPGVDRGGINWDGILYRVMGTSLVMIEEDGTTTTLGTVPGTGQVSFDYSFDRLAIAGGGGLYYWDGSTFSQVTDPDLGTVLDTIWVDGYHMTTDGENLVITELNNPDQVDPTKYGSSEADPDPVVALKKLVNEVHAVNRYSIEVFQNIGGDGFPFQRVQGAQISRGAVGTHAVVKYLDSLAFVGGGRGEAVGVYLGSSGQSAKISTREIDQLFTEYSDVDLASIALETRVHDSHQHLQIRLPDRTLVYDAAASKELEAQVWFELSSEISGSGRYLAQNPVWCYNRWNVAHPETAAHGYLVNTISSHWGEEVGWDFGTQILYNNGAGAILHSVELVVLSGRAALGDDPTIWTSYSLDGEIWSQEFSIPAGRIGNRSARLCWMQQGTMQHWRVQRFRGTSACHASFARLEIQAESLRW